MIRRILAAFAGLAACASAFAASPLDTLPMPDKMFDNREQVHALVVALEETPLHQNADLARAMMAAHYKEVDYLICGDVLGPLAKDKRLAPVLWQIIIASGDWVEGHPDQSKDIDAYTLAGLESGVRAYKNLLALDAKAKNKTMDALVKEYDANTLPDWNKAHPCRPG